MIKNEVDYNEDQRSRDDEKIVISVDDICHALERLFKVCKDRGLHSIEVCHQTYWTVDPDDAFNSKLNNPTLGLGDIYDDAEFIKDFQGSDDGLAGLHFINIASLLNYMGSRYPSLSDELLLEKVDAPR
jgi:hypothetical protein